MFGANVGVMAMYWQHAHAPKTADVSSELDRLRAQAKSAQEELGRQKDLAQQEREEINRLRIRAKKEQEEINRQYERTKKEQEEIDRLRIQVTSDQKEIDRQKARAKIEQEDIDQQGALVKKEQAEIDRQKALAKIERDEREKQLVIALRVWRRIQMDEREKQLALANKKAQDDFERKKGLAKVDPSIPTPKKLEGDLLVIVIETTELRRRSFDALAAQLADFQENHVAKDLKRELLGGAIHVTRTKDCVPWNKDDAAGPAFANDAFHDAFQRAFADAEKLTAQAKNPAAVKAV